MPLVLHLKIISHSHVYKFDKGGTDKSFSVFGQVTLLNLLYMDIKSGKLFSMWLKKCSLSPAPVVLV